MAVPLLAVSGWAHDARALSAVVDGLAESFAGELDDRCYALHELAAAAGDHGPNASRYAAGLVQALETVADAAVLLGWSTGALVALEAALLRPDRVRGLLLLGACARYTNDEAYRCGVPEKNLRALMLGLRRRPQATLLGFLGECAQPAGAPPAALQQTVDQALALGGEELTAGLEYLRCTDLRGRLAELQLPALLLHGDQDRVVPVAAGRYLARHLPGADLREFIGEGHALLQQSPELLVEPMRDFLEGLT